MQRLFVWACVCISVMLLVATMKLVSSDPQAVFYTHYHSNFQQNTHISIGPRSLLACGGSGRKYSVAISHKNGYADPKVVAAQLNHFGLTQNDFATKFTARSEKS
jgi:hypothetical protein